MSSYKSVTTPEMLVRLWCHESKRVFEDRLINAEDHAWFKDLLKGIVSNNFQMDWYDVVPQVSSCVCICCCCFCFWLVLVDAWSFRRPGPHKQYALFRPLFIDNRRELTPGTGVACQASRFSSSWDIYTWPSTPCWLGLWPQERLIYGDYMVPGAEPTVYEEVPDLDKLTVRTYLRLRLGAERFCFLRERQL